MPFDQGTRTVLQPACQLIGVTRKKDAVALWGIVKHDLMKKISLYYDFNPSTATTIVRMVQVSPGAVLNSSFRPPRVP